ncbi:carbonic anhydrase [Novispirillum sp. DQ9]|uniref:carbonic anhydrase n=1 Tax=Novispirillum sp. DQ9 TaxID=3398612 RepID=UPI003C7EBF44
MLTRVALGAGAALLSTVAPRAGRAAGTAEALLLSCMDYRLIDDIVRYMDGRGLRDRYDHVILAGASLGALQDRNVAWGQTFWDHVDVALRLHHIGRVIVMDHRDCGAYAAFLGPDHARNADSEFQAHATRMRALREMILARHPALAVELLFMALDGTVETVA